MKKSLLAVALFSFVCAGSAHAADPATKPAPAAKPAAAKAAKPAGKAPAKSTTQGKPAASPEVTEAVRDEMSKLVEQAVQLSSAELQKGDTFTPYGVLKLADGSLKSVLWKQPNPPPTMEIFRRIYFSLQAEAARNPQVIAAVTVAPSAVTTTDGKTQVNGIRAEVDHRNGAPSLVFIPFMREDGKLVFGTSVYQPGRNPVFPHGLQAADAAAKPAAAAAKPAAQP